MLIAISMVYGKTNAKNTFYMEAAIHERLHVIDFPIGGIWEVHEEVSFRWAVFVIFVVIIVCFRSGLSGVGQ